MQFEWDTEKAESNLKKHGVSFEEASTVFGDLSAKMFYDDEHSFDETREFIVGYSEMNRLLVVHFTERENKQIRIITARKPTSFEREDYEKNESRRRK
ncbi:BrnT family toxin [soil metagenome]